MRGAMRVCEGLCSVGAERPAWAEWLFSGPVPSSGPALGGVLGLCPPPSSLTQGPLRPGHSSRPVSLGGGAGPTPTDPESPTAPGGGVGCFPAHLEVMTPFLLPGGATDVSSQAWPWTGGGVQRPPTEKGSPQTGGALYTASSRGSRQCHRGIRGSPIHSLTHGPARTVMQRTGWGPGARD